MYSITGDENSDCEVVGTKSHCKEEIPCVK